MPLSPINISKNSSAAAAFRIEAGRIVEYEQHSRSILAVALQEKKGKWAVLNQHGAELELAADRLSLLPGHMPANRTSREQKAAFLEELEKEALRLVEEIQLEEVWELLLEQAGETSVEQIAEVAFGSESLETHLAARRALLVDQVFFKRKKYGFEPRPKPVVEELKLRASAEKEKQCQREKLIASILTLLNHGKADLPAEICDFEEVAALGRTAPAAKEVKSLLEEIAARSSEKLGGRLEDQAFNLLVALGRFSPDEDLNLIRLNREVSFTKASLDEAQRLADVPLAQFPGRREDLRSLSTITIDGLDTKDFDDALSLERTETGFRVGIHITDAPALVLDSPILKETAFRRATSIYCADRLIPMLPPQVSEAALSLIEGQERAAITFFIDYDDALNIRGRSVCRSLIKITKRFTYEEADKLLCQEQADSFAPALLQLWEMSSNSETRRLAAGAIQFGRKEMNAKIEASGKVVLEDANEDTPAHRVVSEMMILANETAALFAREHGIALIFRSQEPPDVELGGQGLDIPEGPAREYYRRGFIKRSVTSSTAAAHSGLGLDAYAQVTSPIRRAADLVNLAQIASFLDSGEAVHNREEIDRIIALIEPGLDEASQIQRERNRYYLLKYLVQQSIQEIGAVILRVDGIRPLAELDFIHSIYPFNVKKDGSSGGAKKEDLGRRLKLRIEHIDPRTLSISLKET